MPTVDRNSRDRVASEVRRFLNSEITAFAFDEAIYDIESDDPTDAISFIVCGTTTTIAWTTWFRSRKRNGTISSGCS